MFEFSSLEQIQNNFEECDKSIFSFKDRDDITSLGEVNFNRDIFFKNDSMYFHQEHIKSNKGGSNFSKQDIRGDYYAEKLSDHIVNSNDNNIIKTENIFLETIFDITKTPKINIERNNL